MKRFLIPIVGLAVVGGLCTVSLAAADQIYISNHLFSGRSVNEAGTAWLNLDDFTKAAGIGPSSLLHSGLDNGQIQVIYNKKTFFVPAESRADGLYVDGRRLVEGMGGRWIFNSSLGLTDVALPAAVAYRPVAVNPGTPAASPPPPANPEATAAASEAPTASPSSPAKSPIHIDKFTVIDPTLPGNFSNVLVHGAVTIKNTAADYVDGINIIVHIQDGYENDLAVVKHEVGQMDGGKDVTWEWQWSNASAMLIHPVVEVECSPFISKADRAKMAKEHTNPPEGKKISIRSAPTEGIPSSTATIGGAESTYKLTPEPPAPTASNYAAPTESSVPPGFNPGQDQGTASGSATATSTAPPGF